MRTCTHGCQFAFVYECGEKERKKEREREREREGERERGVGGGGGGGGGVERGKKGDRNALLKNIAPNKFSLTG